MADGNEGKPQGATVRLTLLNPAGAVEIAQAHAPRLASLAGKKIAELSNGVWEDDRIFERMRAA